MTPLVHLLHVKQMEHPRPQISFMALNKLLYNRFVRPYVGFKVNSPATRQRLDLEASRRGLSLSDLVRLSLYTFLRASTEGHPTLDAFDDYRAFPFSE